MDEISLQDGVDKALDALLAKRLALLCGAGLSMAAPSSLPNAAALAAKAKAKYGSIYGTTRPPLPDSIDAQAEFFFDRGELFSIYLRSYVDADAFAKPCNQGHVAVADLLLVGGVGTAISTNVDALVETAGLSLFGQIGVGITRNQVAALDPLRAPYLKIHGCWTDPATTVWAPGQVDADPVKTRLQDCGAWLTPRLLNSDLLVVGYWTDWDYLNSVLEMSLGAANPARVIVVAPCATADFPAKAPALYSLGNRAAEFCHVRCSGDIFLDKVRVEFSKTFVRRVLTAGEVAYREHVGIPEAAWLDCPNTDSQTLWLMRRDLEGCNPNEPAKLVAPHGEPLIGMTLLQLRSRGATPDGPYWLLNGRRVRLVRAANRTLQEVEAAFSDEVAPVIAPDVAIAVGAESLSLPPSIARGYPSGSIARGASTRWLARPDAVVELGL